MPSSVHTPRDRLQRLVDYGVRAFRYWWLVAAFVVLGGAVSLGFALTRKHRYQSSSTLFYQERIQTSVLQGRDSSTMQRNIGDRYKELLLARSQLAKIIEDPEVNPFPDTLEEESEEIAIEQLRAEIGFEIHGQNAFRILYHDNDPHRAQKVAQRLTDLLIQKESELRIEQANATVKFAQEQLTLATDDLIARENAKAQFLYAHPEFAEDEMQGQGEGAAVRRQKDDDKPTSGGPSNPRLSALQRQRVRIKARLEAADHPVVIEQPRERAPTAAEQAASRKVDSAESELRDANGDLQTLRDRGLTDNHPDVRKARERATQATQRVKDAKAELAQAKASGDVIEVKPPSSAGERIALEKELKDVEAQIAAERARASSGSKAPVPVAEGDIADKVVQLEAQWSRLRREQAEQGERVETLNESVFRAQLDAQTRLADSGSALEIVDPAFLPKKPMGKGKKLLVLAGLFIFTALGLALAVGLAILDDRIYRRVDLELLDIAPVLGVIPKKKR